VLTAQSSPERRAEEEPAAVLLSRREREVLKLVAHGLNDREIAEQLILSPHTVHRHVANIRHKLGRGSRTAAVAEAARLGLL
jgi:DNA-binding NarL/FixJ family response regulator